MLLIAITFVLVVMQFALPRRIAFLPLLIAVFHVGNLSVLSEFTPVRLLILAGLTRAIIGGFFEWSPSNRLDLLAGVFGVIALISSVGHAANGYVPSPLIERVGLVLNVMGSYLYGRAYCFGDDFIPRFAKILALVLIPLALFMAVERVTGQNQYASLGARAGQVLRNEQFRARGPFGHAILAGTAMACSLPFMVQLWETNRMLCIAGGGSALVGIFGSGSSGPIAVLMANFGLLFLWRWRDLLGALKVGVVVVLLLLQLVATRPIWFLISRVDLVGGSTGWHRSKLIDSAIKDLGEWWLFGTDYTRHWMSTGVNWNPNHTDITNYYLQFGVLGGLPLMLAFIAMVIVALRQIETSLPELQMRDDGSEFSAWCLWVSILSFCLSFISIALFDQSYAFFFLLVGAVPAIAESEEEEFDDSEEDEEQRDAVEPTFASNVHSTRAS